MPARSLVIGCCTFIVCALSANSAEWEKGIGFRRLRLEYDPATKPGFSSLPPSQTGITWTNFLSATRLMNKQNMMNGAGLALGDFDGDGLCDLYFCNREGRNALYRNLGNWKFEDVTEQAGVACTNQLSTGATFADIDGDGKLDLIVNSFQGPNACFLNEGNGHFKNITEAAGLISKGGTTSLALGDLDGDGALDLYVAYFGIDAIMREGGAYGMREMNGKMVISGRFSRRLRIVGGRVFEVGEQDMLFKNEGAGKFQRLDWNKYFFDEDGKPMECPFDYGLAVQIRDINNDGYPDIYLCNDFQTPDRVWLNDGTGHFRAIPKVALRNMSYASMGVDFGDLDRDGKDDFLTVEMLSRSNSKRLVQSSPMDPIMRSIGQINEPEDVARNVLNWNRGDGTYAEIAFYSEVAASWWSWTPIFIDVDLDGYEDILISNGHMHDVNNRDAKTSAAGKTLSQGRLLLSTYPALETPNSAFHNKHDLRFEEVGPQWGFDSTRICHGMAMADLDGDGDQDIVISCANASPLIYRNNGGGHRLAVRLKGSPPNSQGIGARITVTGGPVVQAQEMIAGGRYLSGEAAERTFATGTASTLAIEVRWRSGRITKLPDVAPDYLYEIDESSSVPAPPKVEPPIPAPFFTDISTNLNHQHFEESFDDFIRQPLLPKKLSQLGPGIACGDINGDGHEDLVIGSGRSGGLAIFKGDGAGHFESAPLAGPLGKLPDDSAGLLLLPDPNQRATLLAAVAAYETESQHPPAWTYRWDGKGLEPGGPLSGFGEGSPGATCAADIDGDGDLDLFMAGRLIAGRYPEAASSVLYRNENGKFVPDSINNKLFEKIGMVSASIFTDLDGDGFPELVLAVEWGPVRVFANHKGQFEEVTKQWGLENETGLWNSIAAIDADGDGRMDLVAGNWGLNSFYNLAPAGPWYLYHGDLGEDGLIADIEAFQDPETRQIVPWRSMDLLGKSLPFLHTLFPKHAAYAAADLSQILGPKKAQAARLEVKTLASKLFLNREGKFAAHDLPREAQWSPVFGMTVADFDGDGTEDLLLAQNFFAARPEDDRLAAGRGLLLRGSGTGEFKSVPGQESGILVYGEQRGSATADFDEDGRPDVVITQNGAATKLYRNARGLPGLRVRLKGPPGNPQGIGALLRIVSSTGTSSPARELHAGGGYWSQDSSVAILQAPEGSRIQVTWPGGKKTLSDIPPASREIEVELSGAATKRK